MAEAALVVQRPDIDIRSDVERLVSQYPPLVKDRHHFDSSVVNGVVILNGNISTPINRRYLQANIPRITGVTDLNLSNLFDDETIRLDTGRILPPGVSVGRVEYGTVVLTGTLPEGEDVADLIERVDAIPGVWQVLTQFS